MKKTMKEELEKETAGSLRIVFVSEGDFENGTFGRVDKFNDNAFTVYYKYIFDCFQGWLVS